MTIRKILYHPATFRSNWNWTDIILNFNDIWLLISWVALYIWLLNYEKKCIVPTWAVTYYFIQRLIFHKIFNIPIIVVYYFYCTFSSFLQAALNLVEKPAYYKQTIRKVLNSFKKRLYLYEYTCFVCFCFLHRWMQMLNRTHIVICLQLQIIWSVLFYRVITNIYFYSMCSWSLNCPRG